MTTRQIIATLFATGTLAGCGSGSTGSVNSAAFAPDHNGIVAAPASAASGGSATTGSSGPSGAITIGTPAGGDIERTVTADYTVPQSSFLDSFDGVITRAVGMGGYVVSSNTNPDGSGRIVSGEVTLKVPAAQIAGFLNGMPSTFRASSINFASVDHTAGFVDVNARLASAHAHLNALDTLLNRATSLSDITDLEQQIENVQTEIDIDQGQLNVLTASVEMATATIGLTERGATTAITPAPGPLSGGLGSGWNNAIQVTGAILEGVVTALPLIVLAILAWVVWRRQPRPAPASRRPELPDQSAG